MTSKSKKKRKSSTKKRLPYDRGTTTFREVDIDLLDEPVEDLRFFRSSAFEDSLLNDMRREGVLIPVIVRPKPNSDRFVIIDGVTRTRNARLLGERFVLCQIMDVDEASAIKIGLKSHIYRKAQDPVGLAKAFKRLHVEFKLKYKDIAKDFGYTKSWTSKLVALNDLPVEYQQAVSRRELSIEDAYGIVVGDRHILEHIDERRQSRCESCGRPFDPMEVVSWRLCYQCRGDLTNIQEERERRFKDDMERADKRGREGQKLLSDD